MAGFISQRAIAVIALGIFPVAVVLAILSSAWPRVIASTLIQYRECVIARDESAPLVVGYGDSITHGHTLPSLGVGASDSYIDVLACSGDAQFSNALNVSYPGAISEELVDRLEAEVVALEPAVVYVAVGVNDIRGGHPERILPALDEIKRTLEAAGIAPVFGLVPPSEHFPDEVMAVNSDILEWASEVGASLVDFWTPLADRDGTYRPGMSEDGIHPSATGARAMALAVASAQCAGTSD